MNVELPDGTVVEGIPDGISRADLATKLKANGMTVPDEWLGPKKVGFIDSALRTAASSAQRAVRTFDLAAASMAGIFGQTEDQDKIFREMEGRQERMNEAYAPKADEEFSTPGTLAGGVLSVPNAIVSGPVSAGVDRSAEVLKRGGTGTEAAKAGAASATIEAAMLAVPAGAGVRVAQKMGAAGKGAARSVTAGAVGGAALNVPVGIAGRAADAAALPDRPEFQDMKQDPLDPKAMAMDAVMSGGIAALAAKGAHTSGAKKAQAKAAEAKAAEWPTDKMETLGGDEFRAPNGATVTKEAWENSSQKIRDGWLKPKPVEEKAPAAEAKELTLEEANKLQRPEDMVDTTAEDKILAEHPTGPIAEVASEVRAKKLKAAVAAAEQTKNREAAADMRRVAGTTADPDLKAGLLARADKLDPPAKMTGVEVKEGEQPEIKVDERKPLTEKGVKVEEVPLDEVVPAAEVPKAGEIPAGEVLPEGGRMLSRDEADAIEAEGKPIPVGEAKPVGKKAESTASTSLKGLDVTEHEMLPVGQAIEGQPDIPVKAEKIPAGEAIEGDVIPVGEVVDDVPVGKAETYPEGGTYVPPDEAAAMRDADAPVPVGKAKDFTPAGPTKSTAGTEEERTLRAKWKGLAGAPIEQLRASETWDTAQRRLRSMPGGAAKLDEVSEDVVRRMGQARIRKDQVGYLTELTRRIDREIAKLDTDAATPGTLSNRRTKRESDARRDETNAHMHKAAQEEIRIALKEASDLNRQGRLTQADLREMTDIAENSPDSHDTASRLRDLIDSKQEAREIGGRKDDAANENLDLSFPKIDEAFMAEQARPRVRGAEQRATVAMDERGRRHTRAALEKAAADGKLNKDGVALATWALDKNPNLGADLKVAVMDDPSRPNARGAYNSAERVVKLFQGRDAPLTAAHEILHHSERMMPQKVQDGIRREWRRHLAAEMKKATPEQRQVLADIPRVINGDADARARVMKAFEGGVLNRNKHYQLYDPSEFWAENASRILSERHGGRGSWTAEAKQWLREMVEHVKGTIGLRSDAAVLKALNDILDAKATPGRRRSEGMLAHTDVSDMLDLGPSKAKLPDETRADVIERKLFDRFNRVAKLQQVQPPKRESADIYQADQLYHGRLQARGDKLEREVVRPLGKALEAAKKLDVSVRDADDYLMALHAPERNAVIAARNPKMQDGGSGITNQQAQDIIDSFNPEQRKALDGIAKMVHDLNRKKLDGMVDDGLITTKQRDDLNQQFKNYVPLKTLDGEDTFLGTGQGYSMRANDITSALGRQSKASSPIAASVMDASRAMVRGEKARVDRTIWEYADRDAQDFIRPYDPENPPAEVMDRKIGPDGKVKDIVSSKKVQEMTIDLVVNGEDRKVFIPDDLLREQIKKVATTADPGEALRILGKGTGAIGRLLTEFNPSFTIPNAVKDAITVAMRAGAHPGVSAAKVMANIPGAWKAIVEHKVGAKTKGSAEYEEFLKHGGKTGAYGIQTAADTMAKLEKLGAELGYDEHAAGYTRKVGRFLAYVPRAISSANEVLEYASRFSLYKEVRAAGGTPGQAAKAAKEITVNFNRSGEWGRAMNAWSVFANAALQGLRNTGVYMKSPVVRRNVMAMTVLGGLVQYWNEQVGGENEETAEPNINSQNDAVADKNLVMLKPGSREGYKIPLPPEYAAFFTIGRRVYRAMSQGDIAREAQGIAGAVLDAALPVRMPESDSHVGSAVRALFPTVGAPVMDLKVNENFFGQPIVPEQRGRTDVPYFTQSRQNTSELTKTISEIANSVTGGDNVKPGYSQKVMGPVISPEGLEHLAKGYTGGIGQTVTQAGNLLKAAKEGKPVDVNKVPVVSRFVFQEPQSYTSRRYKELATDFEQAKGYRKRGESGKIAPRVQATLEQYEVAEKELTALFKELREAGATGTDREPIQQRIKATQSRVIRAYNQSHEQ